MGQKRIGFLTEGSLYSYQNEMLEGLEASARLHDTDLVRFSLASVWLNLHLPDQLEIATKAMNHLKLDGLIFLSWMDEVQDIELVKKLFLPLNVPIVAAGKIVPSIPSVYMKGYEYVKVLLNHQLTVHHARKIAYIHPVFPDDRLEGYRDFMKTAGLYDPAYEHNPSEGRDEDRWDVEKRASSIVDFLLHSPAAPFDAVLTMYNHETNTMMDKLKAHGMQFPRDLAVLCWEDGDRCRFYDPPITGLYYPYREIAYEASEKLHQMIAGHAVSMISETPTYVITRESCGCGHEALKKIDALTAARSASKDHAISIETVAQINPLFERAIESARSGRVAEWVWEFERHLATDVHFPEDLHRLRDGLIHVRSLVTLPFAFSESEKSNLETLCLKGMVLLQDRMEFLLGKLREEKQAHSKRIMEFSRELSSVYSFDRIFDRIRNFVVEVLKSSLVLYLLPKNDQNVSSLELCLNIQGSSVQPLVKELRSIDHAVDLLFQRDKRRKHFAYLIHTRMEFLGLIFFEPGIDDERPFETLAILISSAIKSALVLRNFQESQKEIQRHLETIHERTAELEKSNRKLSDLDKLKNDFIANITHDFRSPLSIIMGASELGILESLDPSPDLEPQNYYQMIFDTSQKLKAIIDRFLDLAKMDAQGVKLNAHPVRIRQTIVKLAEFYRSSNVSPGIRVDAVVPDTEVENFHTDPDKLEEILNNLISNAFKFVDETQGRIALILEERPTEVAISVQDNGVGIPPEHLETIFQRFQQLEPGRNHKNKGTGIGLAFSKQLAGYLKGSIEAFSAGLGQGSTFTLTLPKGHEHFGHEEWQEHLPNARGALKTAYSSVRDFEGDPTGVHDTSIELVNGELEFDPKKAVILIADDQKSIRDVLRDRLKRGGYRNFVLVSDGTQALEAVYKYRPDLIISDVNMPHLRGDEFFSLLSGNPEFTRIPFLFLSAVSDKNFVMEMRKQGVLAFLTKPVESNELLSTLEYLLRHQMENKKILAQAQVDELTGLENRHSIVRILSTHMSQRGLKDFSVLVLDLDAFQEYNDLHGFSQGDDLLRHWGRELKAQLRPYDAAGRLTADKFVVLLPETNLDGAETVAEKFTASLEKIAKRLTGNPHEITLSIGIGNLIEHASEIERQIGFSPNVVLSGSTVPPGIDVEAWASLKTNIGELLIDVAYRALVQAKTTYCPACTTRFERTAMAGGECPNCRSAQLLRSKGVRKVFTTPTTERSGGRA